MERQPPLDMAARVGRRRLWPLLFRVALCALALLGSARGHGQLNHPPSVWQGPAGKIWPGALSGRGAGGFCEQVGRADDARSNSFIQCPSFTAVCGQSLKFVQSLQLWPRHRARSVKESKGIV